jgi:type IV pilus assembly protein PilY1
MTTRTRHLTTIASALYGALLVFLAQPVRATVPVSDVPLFLQVAVPPNIVLTLDDSVSMARAYVPEHCGQFDLNCSALNNRWAKSTYGNPLYYNPRVKYPAPRTGVGQNVLPATSGTGFQWTSVYRNGFDTGYGTINMTTGYRPTASLAFGTQNGGTSVSETYMNHFSQDAVRCSSNRCQRYTPPASGAGTGGTWSNISGTSCSNHSQCSGQSTHAYYYVYNENNANCNKTPTDNDCYTIRFVTASSGPGDFDLNDDGKIDALDKDERQNFANWYAFSRTRTLATQTAATIAFADLDPSIRVAWQGLSTCTGNSTFVTSQCQGYKKNFSFSNAIKPFDGTHKSNFYKWLFQQPTVGYTLLPKAMQRVGEYYKQSGANSPYDDNLTSSSVNTETSCRRNYHVMMTDGIWTESVAIGNSDNTTGPLGDPSAPSYQRQRPYVDSTNNTLADVAFHYWRNDLRSGLENNLTPQIEEFDPTEAERYWNPKNNPATWQHMVNFTIGLGLTGFLKAAGLEWDGDMYGGSYPKLKAGTINWPAAFGSLDNSANVADLWHAAINSRGKFFSADDPKSLSDAFTQALETIAAKSGSSAALSANSTSIQPGNTVIYQAKFNSDWSGTLVAIEVLDNGKVGQQLWSAAELIPPHNQRRIFTYNGTTGLEFTTAVCSATGGLNAAQRSVLNRDISGTIDNRCADRVEWLRGNPASEVRNGGTMRNRPVVNGKTNVMGDIINSDPAFVYRQDYGYSQLPVGGSEYPAFLAANASRRPMIYVGANDGKLYGIDAGLDADDPEKGKERFAYIPGGVYEHLNELTDPNYTHRYYVDGSISVGDAYLGGSWKSVLVAGLNAGGRTIYALDVTDPENFKASNVLWEFTDEDLGLTYSQPQIAILENGQWVVVFGNGYNSTNGGAYLYVVNLANGQALSKIRLRDVDGDESNGVSTPLLVDLDGNGLIDTAYVGDLHGNLWKVRLSDANASDFGSAYPGPLFSATYNGNRQPITAQPKYAMKDGKPVVYFGTGRYLSNADVTDKSVQTFYAVLDDGVVSNGRAALQQQEYLQEATISGVNVRKTSKHAVNWGSQKGWYIDMLPLSGAAGERSVSTPLLQDGRVIFVTVIPSGDSCRPGGTSWLMELDMFTGAEQACVLDLNGDGQFDGDEDKFADGACPTAMELSVGISKTPVWLNSPEEGIGGIKMLTGTNDAIQDVGQACVGEDCKKKEETCEEEPCEEPGVPLRRRSWIQIR